MNIQTIVISFDKRDMNVVESKTALILGTRLKPQRTWVIIRIEHFLCYVALIKEQIFGRIYRRFFICRFAVPV